MNKRRKSGLATHAYLLIRETLYLLYFLIVPHAYQRMDECYVPMDPFEISTLGKTCEGFNPTIFELDRIYVFVDHEKHALCDSYIVEFIHDATENYYERGKYGCRCFYGIKTTLYVLKVLKLLLFYLPMPVTLFLANLFAYKIPMHRKWVRLKCVLNFLLDAVFYFNSYFL